MGAFRVGLGVLFALLLASPASAQFKTADLNGSWLLHATRVGVRQAGEAGWLQGSLVFLQSGTLANDEVRDQDGVLVPFRPGALSVSSSGVVTGVLQVGSGNASIRGQFAEWSRIVGTATADAGAPDETNTFFVMIRQPTGAFTQADAIGTWRLNTLLVPDPRTTTPEWVSGQIVVDGNGAITGGSLTSSNGSTGTSATGTLFVDLDGDGSFTGQLEIGPFGDDHTAFSGTFAPGREMMIGAASRALPGEAQHGILVLQREPAAVFAPADAGGTWEFFSVEALIDGDPVGAWLRGTLTADSLGVVTGGTLTDGFGNSFPVQEGFIVVEGHGFVFAEIFFGSGLDVLALQGSMLSNKAQIFAVDTFGGQTVVPRLGFATLVKPTAAGPTPAIVQFSQPGYTVTEGAASAVITVLSTGTSTTPFTVSYTVTPLTAVPGQDFTQVSGTLSFAAGALSRTFSVPIINNTLIDGTRSVGLTLGPPVGNAVLGQQATAALSIRDNDQGGVIKLGSPTYTVGEAAGSVLVTILRTGTSLAGNVSVAYTTGNGSALSGLDYTATTGTVTFGAGQTSRTVSIPVLNDTLVEGNETFTFTLSGPSGGASLGTPDTALVTIKSEDAGGLVKFSAAAYRFTEGAGNVSVTVVRTGGTASDVTVDYTVTGGTAAAGADFAALSGTLTFAAKQTTATIPVTILQDPLAEGNESFTLTLGNPQGGAARAAPSVTTVTIVDDEAVVEFSLRFVGNMPEVVRTGSLAAPATVDFVSEDGTATGGIDYLPLSGTLTFRPGVAAQYIPLVILPDILAEGPETFTLTLVNPQPEGVLGLGPRSSQTLTIADNDFGGVVRFGTAATTAAPGESRDIPIVRTGSGAPVIVNWQAISGASSEAFSPTSGSVTFAANETSRSFTINVADIEGNGPDVTAVFALSVAPGAATIGTPSSSTLTIVGSQAEVNMPLSVYSAVEGGGPAVVSVIRSGNLDRQVSVAYATSNDTALAGRDYTATSGRLTFAPGQQAATFTVPILDNGPSGQTRSLNLTLSSPSPATTIGEGSNARLQIREAPVFSYRLIADNTEGISGFGGVPSINDGGTVAFKAVTTGDDVGVFTGNGGALTTIASVSADDLLGIDGSRFPIDAAGNVVFLATAGNERRTIFRGAGGTLTPLLQTDSAFTDLFDPSVSPNGTVAFAAQAEGGVAIFTGPGAQGVSLFVAGGDEVFQEVGAFPGVNDDGAVAFVGVRRSGGGRSIFVANPSDGVLSAVVTGVTTDTLASISLNGAGQVAFTSTLPAPDGPAILVGQNGSAPTTFVSTANGFQAFGQPEEDTSPVINALGSVAYLGLTLETFGILIGPGPDTSMVIREGDPLLASNVAFLRFGGYNAAGQIAFRANLLDGREVIVVGTPPASSGSITSTVDARAPSSGATAPSD